MRYKIFLKNGFIYTTENIEIKGLLVCFVDRNGSEQMINQTEIVNIKQEE